MADVAATISNESVSNVGQVDTNINRDERGMKLSPSSGSNPSTKASCSMQLFNGSNISTAGQSLDMISRSNVNNDGPRQSIMNSDDTHSSNLSPNHNTSIMSTSEEMATADTRNNSRENERPSQTNYENSQVTSLTTPVTVPIACSPSNSSSVLHQEAALNCQTSDSADPLPNSHTQAIKIEPNHLSEPSNSAAPSSTSEVNSGQVSSIQGDDKSEPITGNQSEQVKCEIVQSNQDDTGRQDDKLNSPS